MRRNRTVKILKLLPFGVAFIAVFGLVVQQLWNWLLPSLFGGPTVTFWQAWGLLALSWLLFGGWRGMPAGGHHGRCAGAHWHAMTPEEREVFVKGVERGGRHDETSADDRP